jgi:F-type H+-transporting ATPase subunit b
MSGRPLLRRHGDAGIPCASGAGGRFFFRLLPLLLLAGALKIGAAHAAGGSHAGPDYADFAWRVVNFAILAGLIYWLVAARVKAVFAERRSGIRTALSEAAAARDEAQETFREYEVRLAKASAEIEQITSLIEAQGQSEKERLSEEGRKTAEKIREDAQARMAQEFSKASQALRIEAARLSTEMAGDLLKKNIRPEDHEAMVRDYIEKVVKKN